MNKFHVFMSIALIAVSTAEPPVVHGGSGGGGDSGYTYSLATTGSAHGIGTSGYSTIGGGEYSSYATGSGYSLGGGIGHGVGLIGGGDYHQVPIGYQTYEGKHVDPTLLHKVKEILLDQENLEESRRGHISGLYSHGGHGISSVYGVPSNHYGVPSYASRVVAIELGHVQPAIQVAQYHQSQHIGGLSGSYEAPAVHIPSGSYGVPSGSYGVPHH